MKTGILSCSEWSVSYLARGTLVYVGGLVYIVTWVTISCKLSSTDVNYSLFCLHSELFVYVYFGGVCVESFNICTNITTILLPFHHYYEHIKLRTAMFANKHMYKFEERQQHLHLSSGEEHSLSNCKTTLCFDIVS